MDNLPFPEGSRVVAYLRDSGGREQNLSVLQQEKSVGEWCRDKGFILSRIYKDEARSGTKVSGRDSFVEMVDYFSNDKVPEVGIVFWEYSRLSRDYDDLMYYVADLRHRGVVVASVMDQVPEGLEGRLMESIIAWKNAKVIEDLQRAIKRGLRYITDVHHAKLGVIPFGYKGLPKQIGVRRGLDDGKEIPHMINILVPDPDTAPLVRKAFEMRAAGKTYEEVNSELHIFKVLWSFTRFFRNTRYIGEWRGITNFCEPLIDRQLFDQAQVINKQRRLRSGYNHPKVVRSRFFLSGLLYCKKCGKAMYATSTWAKNGPHFDYYRCTGYANRECQTKLIPKVQIENLIIEQFKQILMQPASLRALAEALPKQPDQTAERETVKNRINLEIKGVDSQIDNILKAIKDTGHSRALLDELKLLEDKQFDLKEQLAGLEMKPSTKPKLPKLDDIITQIAPNLDQLSDQEKGTLLRGFIESIRAEKKDGIITGEIGWAFTVSDSEGTFIIPLTF